MMSRHALTMAFAIVVVTSCGVDYKKRTYEHVESGAKAAAGMPSLFVASDSKNKMDIGAPYAAIVSMTAAAPFTVSAVIYEHNGAKVTALAPSSSPMKSRPRSNTTKKLQERFVSVPLGNLKWLAGSTIKLRAEVLPDGGTDALIVQQTFEATKEERHYSCSEYYAMH